MKRSEALDLMTVLVAAYPNATTNEGTPDAYAQFLEDLDAGLVTRAVERLVNASRFLPTVAEIRAECNSLAVRDRRREETRRQLDEERQQKRAGYICSAQELKALRERVGQSMPDRDVQADIDAISSGITPEQAMSPNELLSRRVVAAAREQWGTRTPRTAEKLDEALEESRRRT